MKENYLERVIDRLEMCSPVMRQETAQRLLYVALGAWEDGDSIETQVDECFNCRPPAAFPECC